MITEYNKALIKQITETVFKILGIDDSERICFSDDKSTKGCYRLRVKRGCNTVILSKYIRSLTKQNANLIDAYMKELGINFEWVCLSRRMILIPLDIEISKERKDEVIFDCKQANMPVGILDVFFDINGIPYYVWDVDKKRSNLVYYRLASRIDQSRKLRGSTAYMLELIKRQHPNLLS